MRKKIIGILVIGLVFTLIVPIGTADAAYDCKLTAFGLLRIDSVNAEIKGFVLLGENDGEALRFTFINIEFDDSRAPLEVKGTMPLLMHEIYYNPAD